MTGVGVPTPAFDGAVLCGGASRRMGRDKALLLLDGRPLAARVADELQAAGAGRVEAVGGDADALRRAGLSHRPDRWPGEGPLGGIVTALEAPGGADVVVVASCDLVAPDRRALRQVATALLEAGADAAVPVVAGRHQWLHTAWHRRVAGVLGDVFAAGERSVAGAVLGLRVVTVPELRVEALRDADRPDDLPVRPPASPPAPRISAVQVPEIDVDALRQHLDEGAPLIDVREPSEYEEARAPGARLVPLADVPDRLGEIPTDRTVYVICRSGGRSARAVEYLRGNGVDAVNVTGGTLAWIESGAPVESGG